MPHHGTAAGSAAALSAIGTLRDALADARGPLRAAGRARWVSTAATRYRELVEDALRDLLASEITVDRAQGPVLRHLTAASAAELEAAARPPVCLAATASGGPR